MWEKEKLLIMSNFSFSGIVLIGVVLQTHKNQGLFGKGLKMLSQGLKIEGGSVKKILRKGEFFFLSAFFLLSFLSHQGTLVHMHDFPICRLQML